MSTKGITVTFLGVFRRLYPWQRFQIVGVFPVGKMGSTEVGQPFLMVCSTKPIRTTAGGAFQLESAIYRWSHILIFPLLPGEERMQFESLRRGEIPPDQGDREPDEEE